MNIEPIPESGALRPSTCPRPGERGCQSCGHQATGAYHEDDGLLVYITQCAVDQVITRFQ